MSRRDSSPNFAGNDGKRCESWTLDGLEKIFIIRCVLVFELNEKIDEDASTCIDRGEKLIRFFQISNSF